MNDSVTLTSQYSRRVCTGGFTLIELLLAFALVIVVLTLAMPVFSNYSIRSKVLESMDFADDTKAIVREACKDDHEGKSLQEALQKYNFIERTDRQPYIGDIQFNGTCTDPVITLTTRNTGQLPNPVLTLTLNSRRPQQQESWQCSSKNTPKWRLPRNCRS